MTIEQPSSGFKKVLEIGKTALELASLHPRRAAVLFATLLLLTLAAIYSGWFAALESRLRDFDPFFSQSGEGLIIVDAPQLFTRERLVNERLRESEWIDDQIKLVSKKLEEDKFGKPDVATLTELMLGLQADPAPGAIGKQTEQIVTPSEGAETSAKTISAIDLLKEASGFVPSPQIAFEEARDLREHLSQLRYETILDDAHDLGENTLHRLNFHLTVAPARTTTDSLAAVSIRMSEGFEGSRLIDSYAKLMIEIKKKMQETVVQLLSDRSLIFDRYKPYRLDPTEEAQVSKIASTSIKSLSHSTYNELNDILSNEIISHYNKQEESIKSEAMSVLKKETITQDWDNTLDIENAQHLTAVDILARNTANSCNNNSNINYSLLESSEHHPSRIALLARFQQLKEKVDLERSKENEVFYTKKLTIQNVDNKPVSDQESPGETKSDSVRRAENELQLYWYTITKPITLTCWNNKNVVLMSKLRVLGILYYLHLRKIESGMECGNVPTATAVRIVLGLTQAEKPALQNRLNACGDGTQVAEDLRKRLRSTGAEIGQMGLAFVFHEILSKKLMETTLREGRLGAFFKFSIDDCTVEHCQIKVETLSETYDDIRKKQTIGWQEAYRLFLELNCYAYARSYTIWPRLSERYTSIGATRKSGKGILSLWRTMMTAEGNTETAGRQDPAHIFGIGDWGAEGPIKDVERCPPQVMEKLNKVSIGNNALADISLNQGDPPRAHKEDLRTTAKETAEKSAVDTHVNWIVAPRQEEGERRPRHVASSRALSAIVSLPSWWAKLNVEITTCWVRPRNLQDRVAAGSLCEGVEGKKVRHIELPLPGKAQDVLQKLGFFILRTPYLDIAQQATEPVEAGRRAQLRLVGGRLWKNPRVRLGTQWHDRIEVLPNMQGLVATFDCVQPSPDARIQIANVDPGSLMSFEAPASNGPQLQKQPITLAEPSQVATDAPPDTRAVQVWTSEGVAPSHQVRVIAFRPRHLFKGEPERPCWDMAPEEAADRTTLTSGSKPGSPALFFQ